MKASFNSNDKELGEIYDYDNDVNEDSSEEAIVFIDADEEDENDKKGCRLCKM